MCYINPSFYTRYIKSLTLSILGCLYVGHASADANSRTIPKVTIIAPSSKGSEANLKWAKPYICSLNCEPDISEKIYSQDSPFYSNSDSYRANDLVRALCGNSKIIWCMRGGSGAARLIPYLEKLPQASKEVIARNRHKKYFIGYSDITALHLYLQQHYGWQTIHGTMLEKIADRLVAKCSVDKLKTLILNQAPTIQYTIKQIPNGISLNQTGLTSAIVGGNMTLIGNSIGTLWEIQTKGKILFLENIGMYPYQIERTLDHFKQANLLDEVAAVLFGDFVVGNGNDKKLLSFVQSQFAKSVPFPVFTIAGVGHGHINNPLPLNTLTTIKQDPTQQNIFSMEVQNVLLMP